MVRIYISLSKICNNTQALLWSLEILMPNAQQAPQSSSSRCSVHSSPDGT